MSNQNIISTASCRSMMHGAFRSKPNVGYEWLHGNQLYVQYPPIPLSRGDTCGVWVCVCAYVYNGVLKSTARISYIRSVAPPPTPPLHTTPPLRFWPLRPSLLSASWCQQTARHGIMSSTGCRRPLFGQAVRGIRRGSKTSSDGGPSLKLYSSSLRSSKVPSLSRKFSIDSKWIRVLLVEIPSNFLTQQGIAILVYECRSL